MADNTAAGNSPNNINGDNGREKQVDRNCLEEEKKSPGDSENVCSDLEDKDGPSEKDMPSSSTQNTQTHHANGDSANIRENGDHGSDVKNDLNKQEDEPSSSSFNNGFGLPPDQWTPSKKGNKQDGDGDCSSYNEGLGLPPDQWSPSKKTNKMESDALDCPSPKRFLERRKIGFEEAVALLEEKIKSLLLKDDFTVSVTRSELKVIQRQTRYINDVVLSRRIVEKITKFGFAHVFLKVWKSVNSVEYMSPDNFLAFKNLQAALSIIWNCSDKSAGLCEVLVRCGVLQLFLHELSGPQFKNSPLDEENELYLAKAYMGILHNVVRLCSDSRLLFRNSNAVPILRAYLTHCQALVKIKAFLILSYIIDEHENSIINANDDNIAFLLSMLAEALDSENHFNKTYAFWATEVACGLNHLAVNDSNKIHIVRLGAIPLYLQLLESHNVEEQNLGTAGLWILAFKDENKLFIRNQPDIMQALQTLATSSPQEGIRRAARGALWVLRSASQEPPTLQEDPDVPHVMISYQWAGQQMMNRVKHRLKANGYKVWMDIDNMSGSTLEAMALAVENSAVILVCMSQEYKNSPSCRTEAEYTYRQRKDVIPVLLQPGYEPDGWLGMLVGTRIYIDLTNEELFETSMQRLMKELGNRGRIHPAKHSSPVSSSGAIAAGSSSRSLPSSRSRRDTDRDSDELHISLCSSTSSLHSYVRIPAAQNWTSDDVAHWLHSQQLGHMTERLTNLTGDLLLQYKKMMTTAPEYFYSSLERQLHLDIVSSLKFAKALDALK